MGEPDRAQAVSGGIGEIAGVFLRLGTFGFGGPVAMMAMMEQECCTRRGWVAPERFREIYAICKLLPGPVATQMAISLGRVRGGALGGVAAGVAFVLPAFALVLGLSVVYTHSGAVQKAGPALVGLQAAALAVIALSTWSLAKPYREDWRAWGLAAASAAIVFARPGWEPLVIFACGATGVMLARKTRGSAVHGWLAAPLAWAGGVGAGSVGAGTGALGALFWTCFKSAMFVFGTGLAVVPVLQADVVGRHGWLTHSQFMDGLAIGQVTPGPMVITSTFIGYLTAGWAGALAATLGMFLPSFINVLVLVPRIWKRFSGTPEAAAFSAWAVPAVIGGILGTTGKLAAEVLTGWGPAGVFAASLGAAALRWPPWAVIPAGGALGWVLSSLG